MHGEQAQRAATALPVVGEVQTPAFVRPLRRDRRRKATSQPLLTPAPLAHLQSFRPVEPMHSLVIVAKPFAAQQHQQSSIAPAPSHRGMTPQSFAHRLPIEQAVGLVVVAAHGQIQQLARTISAHRITLAQVIDSGAWRGPCVNTEGDKHTCWL